VKVLILEDDKWLADSLRAGLESEFEVRVCHDPTKVFEVLDKWRPDVLLADVILGEKNLFVLLNEIQSYVDTRVLPVVILSTAARQIKSQDVAEYNVRQVLDKTEITPEILRQTLRETTFSEDPSAPETSYAGRPAEPSLATNLSASSGIYVSESEGKKSSEESVSRRVVQKYTRKLAK